MQQPHPLVRQLYSMNISFNSFKKINKEFSQLSKLVKTAEIELKYTYDSKYQPIHYTLYNACVFTSVAKMFAFAKVKNIRVHYTKVVGNATAVWWDDVQLGHKDYIYTLDEITNATPQLVNTLKLVPETIAPSYRPKVIRNAPVETTEGNYTYRFVTSYGVKVDNYYTIGHSISIIARNDEPLYDYLDKGFYIKTVEYEKKNLEKAYTHVVANEYDLNVAHIFMMCEMQPSLTEMLRDGCFINVYEAELLRLKMHKKMMNPYKADYARASKTIEEDYKRNTTLLVVGKLMSGDVEKTVINNITLTKTSATYDQVSIEAADLLAVLYKKLNFNSEFDIYTITEAYSKHIEEELTKEREGMAVTAKKVEEEVVAVNLNEHDAQLEAEEEEVPATLKELATFKINGIEITPSVSNTYQRYLNKVRINKEEIGKAIHRASCHRTQNDYKLFLKSICRMSIKWHDIIANGLPVKIHSTITGSEYKNEEAGVNAPTLKFIIDKLEKCIKIQVDKERSVKISLSKLVKKVATLNKKTDSAYIRNRNWQTVHTYRTFDWCQHELIKVLIEASTFTVKGVDAEGKPVETKTVLMTKDDIVKLLEVANEAKKAAIERSKEFLNTAVKLTKAEIIDFMGEHAYKIEGSLRTYAVVIKNVKVYDYETKQYRCIVNDRHYAGAGYDDIAARLLALKNDSVMQDRIGTLRGAAQPGAENVHNDYNPDRDGIPSRLEEVVDKALAAL